MVGQAFMQTGPFKVYLVLVHKYYSLKENYHSDCIREKTQGREYSWLKSLRWNVSLATLEVSFRRKIADLQTGGA